MILIRKASPNGAASFVIYKEKITKQVSHGVHSADMPQRIRGDYAAAQRMSGKHNKKFKQVDIRGKPHMINGKPELPHTHKGYEHNEKGDAKPSTKEQKMVERVMKTWYNRHSK